MKIAIGSKVTIPAGTLVIRNGERSKRARDTQVTVRHVETTRAGNFKVTWKSDGIMATACLKNSAR